MDNFVTSILTDNKIHACSKNECLKLNKNVKCVQLNALAFTTDVINMDGYVTIKNNTTRVCYSSHSSCYELKEIIEFLTPEKLYFNVIINQTYKEIYENLTESNVRSRLLKDDKKKTNDILKLSNKYKYNPNIHNNSATYLLKRPRLESPERD